MWKAGQKVEKILSDFEINFGVGYFLGSVDKEQTNIILI